MHAYVKLTRLENNVWFENLAEFDVCKAQNNGQCIISMYLCLH